MQAFSSERSSLALTTVVSLATLAALALLAAVLAYWTWRWLAPRPAARALPAAEPARGMASAQDLFGAAQPDRNAAAPTGIAIKLLGVVAAARGRRGYAVLQLEGREILVVPESHDIAPGIGLAEVHPENVVLLRNGVRESLAWPQKNTAAESAAPRLDK